MWRDAVMALGSPGLSSAPVAGRFGSPVIHIPEKSGFPSAIRGVGAAMFTLPSAFRGTAAVGYLIHWAVREVDTRSVPRMTNAADRIGSVIAEAYTNLEISIRDVGDEHASICAVEKSRGVAELGRVFTESVLLRGVFRAEALIHVGDHRLEKFVINVALANNIAAGNHPAICWHHASVGFDNLRQSLDRADTATQP